ncbi:MAG TPA: polysaccharide deacetylase family protein [Mucilaginibacter sp.]|nr:polysaccharide deacetylase family protein [Mucilaginibacter sp.]
MYPTRQSNLKALYLILLISLQAIVCEGQAAKTGSTEITKWQYGKNGAVSITYDDASRNQFKEALPVMERLKMPATFFVITGPITGSKYQGKFIGRPVEDIIKESATIPTNDQNFLERCSAAGYLGYKGTISYHTRAGSAYDNPKRKDRAFKLMDTLYMKVRNGDFEKGYEPCPEYKDALGSTWDEFRKYGAEGYEIASHSITHATMPGMDEANIRYELEKSKEEVLREMGPKYAFSCEVPYGYENERVMDIAYKIYPVFRNRMPEPWLKEIDRAKRETPGSTDKDYIQWQRGATTKTPMPLMKSWVDTVANKNNTWLVLVFHGIDGLGYEALPHTLLDEYFQYIKSKNDQLWVATFGDVARYMREREHATVKNANKANKITVNITHSLDKSMYYLPLTLKTYVPASWKWVKIAQGKTSKAIKPATDEKGSYVLYQAKPNGTGVTLTGV